MSEYQYYEFQAIDRPLTVAEKTAISQLSSRVKPTANRAKFTYSHGDLPGDPKQVLAKYFDVMYYIANWGTQQLAFRLPKSLISPDAISPYCIDGAIELTFTGDWAILDWQFNDEEGFGWIDDEQNILSELINLRQEILQQDYRGLYLAWLKALTSSEEYVEIDTSQLEPPVPTGLSKLSPAQTAFTNIFKLSDNLLVAAASASSQPNVIADPDWARAIAQLSRQDCEDFLDRLVRGETNLALKLKQQLSKSIATDPIYSQPRRSIEEIFDAAAKARIYADQRRLEEAKAKRKKELQALAPRQTQTWEEINILIEKAQSKTYDRAVELLVNLRDLAAEENKFEPFQKRLDLVYENYGQRHALIKRFKKVGLDRGN
jgi:hypothetical protein